MPEATSLAAAIKTANGIDAELIKGKGGAFEVEVDGKLIYSKLRTNRFPTDKEILETAVIVCS